MWGLFVFFFKHIDKAPCILFYMRLLVFGSVISLTNLLVESLQCRPFVRRTAFPPAWVFGVVWPFLYLVIGLSWQRHPKQDRLFLLLTALCSVWLVLHRCTVSGQRWAKAVLVSSAILACAMVQWTSPMMALPAAWLVFANTL